MEHLANHNDDLDIPHRMERGEIVVWPQCPFIHFSATELTCLANVSTVYAGTKDISFDPNNGRFSGRRRLTGEHATTLANIFNRFSEAATAWLTELCPAYQHGLSLDRVTWHLSEEATRQLRHNARNDLLHIDHFSTRPSQGRRLLRLFVNLDQTDPHVWSTSDGFADILHRYTQAYSVPKRDTQFWTSPTKRWQSLLLPGQGGRTEYDALLLRLHHWLKNDHDFQVKAPRRLWSFPAKSMWATCTDCVSYAWLRGKRAIEHSYFIHPDVWQDPAAAPLAKLSLPTPETLLQRAS